jgi:hypothetical protein
MIPRISTEESNMTKNIVTMIFIHNVLAAEIGVPLLKSWNGNFVELAKCVARLNARANGVTF